ncbi:mitochondrial carrier domain-containing protein [Chytridium lagenaria]|nr:mitochondrial carrier domain-containing protein [Chytridium lagenaria]
MDGRRRTEPSLLQQIRQDKNLQYSIAGAGSGLIAAVIVTPLDVVKVRLQNQSYGPNVQPRYKGTFKTLATIWREERIRGLYSGLSPTIIAYLPDRALWFTVYHGCQDRLATFKEGRYVNTTTGHVLATIVASISSTVLTTPIWVVRTRLMIPKQTSEYHYTSVIHAFKTIVKEEGWHALYKGLGPSLLGISHSVVMFPLYEKLKLIIKDYESRTSPHPSTSISSVGILVASAVSKCVASLATYPHEVLRTRLQTQTTRTHIPPHRDVAPPPKYTGIIQTARLMIAEEGFRSMYLGLPTSLIRQVPAGAISLWMYEIICKNISDNHQ